MTATACLVVAFYAAQGAPAASRPATTDGELQAVEQLLESGKLDDAEARLQKMLAQRDGSAARALLGMVWAERGNPGRAEGEFRHALSLDPRRLRAVEGLARALLAQNRTSEAVAELRKAAALGPLDRDLALQLADAEAAQGHGAAAERLLGSAAERFGSVEALLRLARLRFAAGNTPGGRRALDKARELAPNSEDVLLACAQSWLNLKEPARALPALAVLVRLFPTVAEYHRLRGVALLQTDDAKPALDELTEANRIEPKNAPTLIALGTAHNQLMHFADASAVLGEALALDPENVEGLAALARAEEGEGKIEEAETHARRVVARDAGHAGANLVLGTVLMKQKKYAEALPFLERAAAAAPSAKAHYQLSLAYARLGDEVRARQQRALYEKVTREEEERMKALGRVSGMGVIGRPE